MAGNAAVGLTQRDQALVRDVAKFGVMTRDQLMQMRYFTSKTRAKARLKRLVDAGYLSARAQSLPAGGPRFVYMPGPQTTDAREPRKRVTEMSDLFLAHELGLVDVRIAFDRHTEVSQWRSAKELGTPALGLVPDAYVEYTVEALTFCAFVEYDRGTETVSRVEQKVRAYLDLAYSGRFAREFKRRFFRVLVVVDTLGRLKSLSDATARLTDKVLRLTTMNELSRQGPLRSIWRRPGVSHTESLTNS